MAPVHAPSGLHTKSLSSSHMNGMERNVEIVWVLLAAGFFLRECFACRKQLLSV